ncbi:META domain-containing protein [Xinfangfangia sp. D13-10-4-6]|uniref:META domain-containing protein n=1 Tax=Pseudogemmobacter hezensis TaxID=2737662 RepID=UPI001554D370|nr:META domain-containing protein [Pseudogemmobacter hezensis]NPD17337.1 META domain-containing protein [Pseudogemmobacter hezensis]
MRLLFSLPLILAAGVAMAASETTAETIDSGEWQLIAQDGVRVSYQASFAIDAEGMITGKAPCNRYFGPNGATLPALLLNSIASTRMYCDRMADESSYLSSLALMTASEIRGETLVLTGPDDRSLEFARDPGSKSLICDTCGG